MRTATSIETSSEGEGRSSNSSTMVILRTLDEREVCLE